MYVIGVDPGPIPGIVRLHLLQDTAGRVRLIGADALQVTPGALVTVLGALAGDGISALAVERFVVGRRAARSSTAAAGARTRDMVGAAAAWAVERSVPCVQRSAAEVKPWATDARLDAVGLLALTAGMRHARDAGRHAVFCAVRDHSLPDPLSSRAGAQ